MQVADLISQVTRKVQDLSYDDDTILASLNRGLLEIAGGGDRNLLIQSLAPLPDLFTSQNIESVPGSSIIAMPDDFHRGLVMVVNSEGNQLNRFDSLVKMLEKYPGFTEIGKVVDVSLKGRTLRVQPSPAISETLTAYYHKQPTVLVKDSDEPVCLPIHLQERLLVSYAVKEFFAEIEDGIEGNKVNTSYHTQNYQQALIDLSEFIGPEDLPPQFVDDGADYIS